MQTVGSAAELDLNSLNNLEEQAYAEGFRQGHEHGELHGTFEGRELGRDKGHEVWEEVGYYEGMAKLWRSLIETSTSADQLSRKQIKQLQHLGALERLVDAFPMQNKSSDAPEVVEGGTAAAAPSHTVSEEGDDADDDLSKLDMLALLERTRARYRLTCSVLGIPPRGAAVASALAQDSSGPAGTSVTPEGGYQAKSKSLLVVGRMVDPTQLRY